MKTRIDELQARVKKAFAQMGATLHIDEVRSVVAALSGEVSKGAWYKHSVRTVPCVVDAGGGTLHCTALHCTELTSQLCSGHVGCC
jgi:hypothetical protein